MKKRPIRPENGDHIEALEVLTRERSVSGLCSSVSDVKVEYPNFELLLENNIFVLGYADPMKLKKKN